MADQPAYDADSAIRDPAFRNRVGDSRTRARADLVDIGFASAGSIFNSKNDPNVSAKWSQAGSNISSVLQERWFRKEFEGFQDQYLMPYVERLRGLDANLVNRFGQLDTMGQVMQPDGTIGKLDPNSPEAEALKKQWLAANVQELAKATDDLMNASAKYGNGNPLIDERMNGIMASHSEVIGQLTNPQQFLQGQRAQADTENVRAGTTDIGATTAGREADTAFTKGPKTAEAYSRARLNDRLPAESGSGSAAEREFWMKNPQSYLDHTSPRETVALMQSKLDPWGGTYKMEVKMEYQAKLVEKAKKAYAQDNPSYGASIGVDANGNILDQEKMDAALQRMGGRIEAEGVIRAANALFPNNPEIEEELRRVPQYNDLMPPRGGATASATTHQPAGGESEDDGVKVTVPNVPSRSEKKRIRGDLEQVGYKAVERAFKSGQIKTGDEAAAVAQEAIENAVDANPENEDAMAAAYDLAQEASDNVAKSWTDYSPTGREVTDRPSIGDWLDEILSEPTSAAKHIGRKLGGAERKSSGGIL